MKLSAAIIPAAGFGTRMQLDHPKQYHLLMGVPVLVRTVRAFIKNRLIDRIVVVVLADWVEETTRIFEHYSIDEVTLVAGGNRRQDSVEAGLKTLAEDIDIVLVHDGARPLVSQQTINKCHEAAVRDGAAIAAIPVKDTLKKVTDGLVTSTIDRTSLWQAQTPQAARRDLLQLAYSHNGDEDVTDEATLLEKATIPVTIVEGNESNIKITRPEDMVLATAILRQNFPPALRIGHGYDAHRFAKNRDLVLGGITVPYELGLAGHSDADVLTHALCDAILGALGEGDIGFHFPDSDETYNSIYSITLLERVMELTTKHTYAISNCDITIICQKPRLAPYLDSMKNLLAKTCKIDSNAVNIKATTTEKMGFTGREEGISCHAVVLLQSSGDNR
jgi:2-C-methyl-D-erythritol 4-phosphate cytidylyltransferase/2-C-methyl-D-erythritol 2,4-cyclodiphosphate synthase